MVFRLRGRLARKIHHADREPLTNLHNEKEDRNNNRNDDRC